MSAPQEVLEWWESLDFLAPDVRQELGRLMAVLEHGLSLSGTARENDQPAGWSGFARRGPWSRLLPSEWALAQVSAEEFVRRADEGELSFWQLAHEEGDARHTIWVWVDVGPDQLGACRVVQIAILFWLQRMVLASGGQFYWGCIQSPEKAYERFAAEELRSYLNSRSLEVGTRTTETFAGVSVWCVGSPDWVCGLPKEFRRLALTQEDETTVHLVDGSTRLRLRLPEGRRAVRLLRNPLAWGLEKRSVSAAGAEGRMVFSECGRKLVFVDDVFIKVLPLPNSVNSPPGSFRSYRLLFEGHPVVAVSVQGGAISVVQAHQGNWSSYWLNPPTAGQRHLVSQPVELATPPRLGTCWRHWPACWYIWVDDTLYQLTQGGLMTLDKTRGGTPLGSSSVLVTYEGTVLNAFHQTLFVLEGELPSRVHTAPRSSLDRTNREHVLACQMADGCWWIAGEQKTEEFEVRGQVLGLVRDATLRLALVVLGEEGLRLQGGDWSEPVVLRGRLTETVLHPRGLMAYRTEQGDVGVYSFALRRPLWVGKR